MSTNGGQKILAVNSLQKKKLLAILYCHYDYCLDYDWYFLGGKFQNWKLFCNFLLHRQTSGYLCTTALILFKHVGFLEYPSFLNSLN
jgi:hypothetical protein